MQALRAFEADGARASLTRAAQSLHLTHGAISHQIKALEAELGVRLFARAGRGIRLTDEGERFAQRVRGALAELAAAMRGAVGAQQPAPLACQRARPRSRRGGSCRAWVASSRRIRTSTSTCGQA